MQDPSWRLPRRIVWVGAVSPIVLTAAAWLWFFAAWRFLPDVSRGTVPQQENALFWASELPLKLFGGATIALAVILAAYLVMRKHARLAIPLCIYYAAAAFTIVVGSLMFVPFQPPGW